MEYAAQIIVAVIGSAGLLVVGYWQWVYKPKHRSDPDKPTVGDRALDDLFAEKERLQRAIDSERVAHGVTRDQYLEVVTRLATVEAELKAVQAARKAEKRAAEQAIAQRDDLLARLRAELAEVRRDIADIRRGYAG